MLVDPLPVKSPNLSAASALTVIATDSFAVTDISPGKSVRVCASLAGFTNPGTLTIAHSVSNENKPFPTDRLLVRLDVSEVRMEDSVPGNLKAYAYLVVGVPRGALDKNNSTFSPTLMVEKLLGAFAVSPTAATTSDVNLLRMLAGEP